MTVKLGVIGSSAGNGHPYSWSAIFNGYDVEAMQECEYPVIPRYLSKQRWPDAKISGAEVSSIWTQDSELSTRIAEASCIEHISSTLVELESRVDAVLLARDDAENHLHFARQFLLAGKPVYIDKPIALSMTALRELYDLQQYSGQIFTCSALSYGAEFCLSPEDRSELGYITSVSASTPKSWEKYAVHIIEPVLKMINPNDPVIEANVFIDSNEARSLSVRWGNDVRANFSTLGNINSPIQIKIEGSNGSKTLVFRNPFQAFKMALQDYIDGISDGKCRSPFEFNVKVVDLIERGMK